MYQNQEIIKKTKELTAPTYIKREAKALK